MQAVVRIPQEKEKQCGAAHARDQRTQCRTRYPHPEYKDQKRVAMSQMPGSALGLAMVTVIGQCVGARDYPLAKKYMFGLTGVSYALMAIAAGISASLRFRHLLCIATFRPSYEQ